MLTIDSMIEVVKRIVALVVENLQLIEEGIELIEVDVELAEQLPVVPHHVDHFVFLIGDQNIEDILPVDILNLGQIVLIVFEDISYEVLILKFPFGNSLW